MGKKTKGLIGAVVLLGISGVLLLLLNNAANAEYFADLMPRQVEQSGTLLIPDEWTAGHSHGANSDIFYHHPDFTDGDAPAIIGVSRFDDGGLLEDGYDRETKNTILQVIADDISNGSFFEGATDVSVIDHNGDKAIYALTTESRSMFQKQKRAINLIAPDKDGGMTRVFAMVDIEDFDDKNRAKMEEVVRSLTE